MPEKYSGWPTKAEFANRLGISEKTVDRSIKKGLLRTAFRKVPGRRAMVVIDPDDAATFEAQSVLPQAVMMPAGNEPTSGKALVRSSGGAAALLELLQSAVRPITPPLFLTLKQSAKYTGLPVATIRAWIIEERLAAVKTGGGWRIRKRDLQAL